MKGSEPEPRNGGRCAVVPVNLDDQRLPHYFDSREAALAFLDAQHVAGPPQWSSPMPAVSLAAYKVNSPSRAQLDGSTLPLSVGDGPKLRIGEVDHIRELDMEIEMALEWPHCCLGQDWPFEKIERLARKQPARDLRRKLGSIRAYVVLAMWELDTARRKILPELPDSAVSDFWSSHQVERYLWGFAKRLADCQVIWVLAGGKERARSAVRETVNCVSLELARNANSLLVEPPSLRAILCRWLAKTPDPKLQKALRRVIEYDYYVRELWIIRTASGRKLISPARLREMLPDLEIWKDLPPRLEKEIVNGVVAPHQLARKIVARIENLKCFNPRTLTYDIKALRDAGLFRADYP